MRRLAKSLTLQIFDTKLDYPVPVQSRCWLGQIKKYVYFRLHAQTN